MCNNPDASPMGKGSSEIEYKVAHHAANMAKAYNKVLEKCIETIFTPHLYSIGTVRCRIGGSNQYCRQQLTSYWLGADTYGGPQSPFGGSNPYWWSAFKFNLGSARSTTDLTQLVGTDGYEDDNYSQLAIDYNLKVQTAKQEIDGGLSFFGWDGDPETKYPKNEQVEGWNSNPNDLNECCVYDRGTYNADQLLPYINPYSSANAPTATNNTTGIPSEQAQYAQTGSGLAAQPSRTTNGTTYNNSSYNSDTMLSSQWMKGSAPGLQLSNMPEYVPDSNKNVLFFSFCPPLPRTYKHCQVLTNNWRDTCNSINFNPKDAFDPAATSTVAQPTQGTAQDPTMAGDLEVVPAKQYQTKTGRMNLTCLVKHNDFRGGNFVYMRNCWLKMKLIMPEVKVYQQFPNISIYGSADPTGKQSTQADAPAFNGIEDPVEYGDPLKNGCYEGNLALITIPVKVMIRIIYYQNVSNGKIIDEDTATILPLKIKNPQDAIERRKYRVLSDNIHYWRRRVSYGSTGMTQKEETKTSYVANEQGDTVQSSTSNTQSNTTRVVTFHKSFKMFQFRKLGRKMRFSNEEFCFPPGQDRTFIRIAVWKYNINGDLISTKMKYLKYIKPVFVNKNTGLTSRSNTGKYAGKYHWTSVRDRDIKGHFKQQFWSKHWWKASV